MSVPSRVSAFCLPVLLEDHAWASEERPGAGFLRDAQGCVGLGFANESVVGQPASLPNSGAWKSKTRGLICRMKLVSFMPLQNWKRA